MPEGPEAGGMDPPALEDGHALLHPQKGSGAAEVGEEEAGPARVARAGWKEFGEGERGVLGRRPEPSFARRRKRHWTPAFTGEQWFSSRTGVPAGNQAKPWIHTTRNAVVLLLF